MDKDFSNGFLQDIADLIEVCRNNKTDNISVEMDIDGKILVMDIKFSIKE